MSNKYRTHNCNELRNKHVDNDVILSGWINKKRDHGNLLFIDLRDNYGITQCIIDKVNSNFKDLEKIQLETVIRVEGKVVNRSKDTINSEIETGEIEVKLKTKKSLFDWFAKTKSDFLDFDLRKVFIDIPRMDLLPNISKRTELMFKENCLKEVKKFNTMRLNKSLSANKLIGVQEINQFIKDSISLDECKELINIKTRQYAKRQNTWARGHMKNWNKLYSKNVSILLKKTLKVTS